MPQSHAPQPVPEFLDRTRLGPRQACKALSIWPLLLRDEVAIGAASYTSLGTALGLGTLDVGEVSAAGSVSQVRVANRSPLAVLFLFGEEIRGAKQNRIANASFLVEGKSTGVIDVSCVEQGRWSPRPRTGFAGADEVVSHSLRRKMHKKVAAARAAGVGFKADQAEVWNEVGDRLRYSMTPSLTFAYADYRASRHTDVVEILAAFRPLEHQVGFVACLGDEVVGAEAIGHPEVFRQDFAALLRSYAIDSVDAALVRNSETRQNGAARFDAPEPFLAELASAPFTPSPSVGVGVDWRLEGTVVSGCALASDELVHLTAFPAEEAS